MKSKYIVYSFGGRLDKSSRQSMLEAVLSNNSSIFMLLTTNKVSLLVGGNTINFLIQYYYRKRYFLNES